MYDMSFGTSDNALLLALFTVGLLIGLLVAALLDALSECRAQKRRRRQAEAWRARL